MEFTFVLPILMAVTFGAMDVVRMIIAKEMCAYAAVVGARSGIALSNTQPTVLTKAANSVPLLKLTTSNVGVVVKDSTGTTTHAFTSTTDARVRGDIVTVTVTYTFAPLIPFFSKIPSVGKAYSIASAMVIP